MGNTFLNKRNIPLNQGYAPNIEVKLFGNWDKTITTVQQLSPKIKQASIKAQLKVCNVICQKVKSHIMHQDLGWRPLSPAYAKRKAKGKGTWDGVLINYGTYYKNIGLWQIGSRHLVMVGVKRGIYTRTLSGKRSKIDVSTIAAIHEFSSGRKLPRRPLWNPTIAEIGGAKGIKKMYTNSLLWHLRRAGIPVGPFKNLF